MKLKKLTSIYDRGLSLNAIVAALILKQFGYGLDFRWSTWRELGRCETQEDYLKFLLDRRFHVRDYSTIWSASSALRNHPNYTYVSKEMTADDIADLIGKGYVIWVWTREGHRGSETIPMLILWPDKATPPRYEVFIPQRGLDDLPRLTLDEILRKTLPSKIACRDYTF